MATKTSTLKLTDKDHPSSFDNLFKDCNDLKDLPVTHKQDWYTAKATLREGKIKPSPCDVFKGNDLIYYFYGKSSYFVANNIGSRGDNLYFPVCYIFDIESIEIEKVFPFDSGAFANKKFGGFLHGKMDINDFAIKPTTSQIKGFIKTFFNNNDNYYKGKSKCDPEKYVDNDIATAYINIINNKGEESYDERSSSIEILSKTELDLNKHLRAIILPFDLVSSCKQIKELEANGVDIITYHTFGGNPGSYNAVIRHLFYDYLLKHKLC